MERTNVIAANNLTALSPPRAEDAAELFAVVDRNRARLRQWLPWVAPEYSLNDAQSFLQRSAAESEDRASLTLIIRHKGALCGVIGLHKIDKLHKNTSIGYWIDEAHQGLGIITAACRAVVTEGFENFGLHRIEIRCAVHNHRSSAVPRRLEFLEEGILREAEWLHDHWVDLRVFSMLAGDWIK
jgi:ribosomal-protein-serine acetyltransferase